MDKNFIPIDEEPPKKQEEPKPKEETKDPKEENFNFLPDWSIEPPIEINRGQNDIR